MRRDENKDARRRDQVCRLRRSRRGRRFDSARPAWPAAPKASAPQARRLTNAIEGRMANALGISRISVPTHTPGSRRRSSTRPISLSDGDGVVLYDSAFRLAAIPPASASARPTVPSNRMSTVSTAGFIAGSTQDATAAPTAANLMKAAPRLDCCDEQESSARPTALARSRRPARQRLAPHRRRRHLDFGAAAADRAHARPAADARGRHRILEAGPDGQPDDPDEEPWRWDDPDHTPPFLLGRPTTWSRWSTNASRPPSPRMDPAALAHEALLTVLIGPADPRLCPARPGTAVEAGEHAVALLHTAARRHPLGAATRLKPLLRRTRTGARRRLAPQRRLGDRRVAMARRRRQPSRTADLRHRHARRR